MRSGIPEVDRLIAELAAAAAARYGAAALARIAASALPTFQATKYEDARQRPTWVYTPGLPSRPFWTREQCGRLTEMIEAFEAARERIVAEIVALDLGRMGVAYDHLSVDPELIRGWKNLFFFRDYRPDEDLLARVPTLRSIADSFGPAQLDKFELFLSVLEPGTHIPPHYGGSNAKLTLHLPLVIPPGDAAIRVDDETRGWRSGDMVIFDDTFEHEAWNRTSQPRAVLLLKAYHPDLSVEEIGVLEMFAPLGAKVYREVLKARGRGE